MKGSLVSPGMVCYAEKQEKPFWFSSLDQIVHFDAIIFCRTFVELFWSVRVDRKKKSHYNSRVSLHEAPTKKIGMLLESNLGPMYRKALAVTTAPTIFNTTELKIVQFEPKSHC